MTHPILIDSHCHLDMLKLDGDAAGLDGVLAEAARMGVSHMLCVSVTLADYPTMRDLVADKANVSVSVGVHPCYRESHDPEPEALAAIAKRDGCVAIGETGLDYFHFEADADRHWQRERFRRHIAAARACRRPLIVHTRQARRDTLQILREENARDARGVMHCFAEDWETAEAALDLGFYISFSGIVTFKNAVELQAVARQVPADRMLVETDAPYLAPVPKRGRPNRPAWVRHTAECLATLRGESLESVAAQTTANYQALFGAVEL